MGWSFRKSMKLGKRGRVNVSKSGVSGSVGVKGARVGLSKRGVRLSLSIPGTGIRYTKNMSLKKIVKGLGELYSSQIAASGKKRK